MKSTKTYEAPELIKHGSLEALTQGASDGNLTDKVFPTNTPKSQLTFS